MNNDQMLRVLRLDGSDARIYDPVAVPGEWAVPGSFHFWDGDPERLSTPQRQAFSTGFLGIGSFGWTTLVAVAQIGPSELEQITHQLAEHLVEAFGAPDVATALPAAREEIAFAQSLCEHPLGTIIALSRQIDGQELSEDFRQWAPPSEIDHDQVRLFGVDPQDP